MRINGIFTAITFLILILFQQRADAQQLADIKFEKMDYNFGKIKEEGGPATFNFKFTNTGNIPLILQHVEASCGCTTPEWSKEPVLPGKAGFIKVSYNPEMRPGIFTKSITVGANIPKSPVVLTITGEVIPKALRTEDIYSVDFGKIRLASGEMSFVKIKDNEVKTDTLNFFNNGTSPVSVKFKIIPPYITIRTVPSVIPPKTKGYFLITINGTKKPAFGYISNRIYLSFNDEEKYDNAIKISAVVEEDFSKLSASDLAAAPKIDFSSKTFDFGEIAEGKKVENTFKIFNKGKRDLIIRSVTASCGCTTGEPKSNTIQPGKNTEMKVVFDSSEKVGMQNKIITIISNDPQHATSVIRVTGTVRR
jgi:hypothetical protein